MSYIPFGQVNISSIFKKLSAVEKIYIELLKYKGRITYIQADGDEFVIYLSSYHNHGERVVLRPVKTGPKVRRKESVPHVFSATNTIK